jgi:ABC-type glycerol-3-phosphate transport system substrate-binding protein
MMTLVMTLLVFGWLELASVTNMDLSTSQARMRLYLVAAVVVLILLSLLLVRLGWSAAIARFGGVWSAALMLTMFTIAMCTGAAGLRQPLTVELWDPEPRTGRVDVLVKVAGDVSEINTGFRDQLPITISGVNSPALEWLFRNWQTKVVASIPTEEKPDLIITTADALSLSTDYRGGPFPLHEAVDWNTVSTGSWLKWFIYRQLPVVHDTIILWVRSDLMLSDDRLITP